jgi:hypothetical protein
VHIRKDNKMTGLHFSEVGTDQPGNTAMDYYCKLKGRAMLEFDADNVSGQVLFYDAVGVGLAGANGFCVRLGKGRKRAAVLRSYLAVDRVDHDATLVGPNGNPTDEEEHP